MTFATSGASTLSARATGWHNGANSKYWATKVNTLGYQNIAVSVKLRSSNTGPRDFALQYRTDPEGAWLDVAGGTLLVADNFTTGFLESLPLPEAAENQEALFLRLVMTSNLSVTGGVVTSSGANRLDDLIVTAHLSEPDGTTSHCTGPSATIKITEILPYPQVSDQEYAELFNSGDQCVDISGWRLEDGGGRKYIFPASTLIEPGAFFTLIQNLFLNNTTPDSLTLYNQENEEVDRIEYEKAIKGLSYSFDGSSFRFTSHLTPGEANVFDELDEEEIQEAGSGVRINEIFPNPLGDEAQNEFVELFNTDTETKDLKNWSLVDASQKIFTFTEATLFPGNGFLTLPRSTFGFSLNNSGTETLTLLDPQGNPVASAAYTDAQENFSYSYDGSEWRWSKKQTPGKPNAFSKSPRLIITTEKVGYVDVPLAFKAEVKDAKKPYRYSWDFGDGHRSTLAEPKHTFPEKGTYPVSVTLRSESGIAEKNFTLTIKKYPQYPVYITRLMPNPQGQDNGTEWVEITNASTKTVNLAGWKLATDRLEPVSHPFLQEIILSPHQTLRLTRRHAAFSLPNSQGVVELRYPNDEVASTTQYEAEEIAEDTLCTNENAICNFKDSLSVKTKGAPVENEKEIKASLRESAAEEVSNTPTPLPSKKEILQRMGKDFNLLINQLFLEHLNS